MFLRQLQLYCPLFESKCSKFEVVLITCVVWDWAPLKIEVKHAERTQREHPESRAVSDYSVPSEEDELILSGCWVAEQQRTCEDVLAQSSWAAIFAVVEVFGGALEVLDGQAVAQDIWLQVRTRAELLTTNTQEVCTRNVCSF